MNLEKLDAQNFLKPFREGKSLYSIVGLILMLCIIIGGAAWMFDTWTGAWRTDPGSVGFFGWIALIVWQIAWLYAAFSALQTMFMRAVEIRQLPPPDNARYMVPSIIEIILRGVGEALLVFHVVMAVPAMLAVWFNGFPLAMQLVPSMPSILAVFPWLQGGARFFPGIMTLVGIPVIGLLSMLAAYFSADLLIALFSIANDVREIKESK